MLKEKGMLGDVHRFRGCNVSYAIKCKGGEEGYHVYVGSTRDVEQRMMNHARGRAAKVTKCRPPTGEILHIREHDTYREAMLCEVSLWNLWAGKIGFDRVRGGRWNCPGPLPYPPREWRSVTELTESMSELSVCPKFHADENESLSST